MSTRNTQKVTFLLPGKKQECSLALTVFAAQQQ